ncbi:hypothetical protein [Xanthomonas oryzae]|nr:hypothetical protein [Xanthomonas oryzae]AKN93619.1 hypothetical protein ACU13_11825 [Xanthomonas oryzae pv. oryzicola]AKN97350.1 hypothetical protein ACU10_11770 [Xanthomonas oryzae pv. oryzicola]AKO12564.1 hypothetical protein ACU14_11770 [Xanthomonas oryzae pv. oryzicola]AKO16308.1 hypothetical protein ACU12_11810 [Xanthomonas oryzae pv. oryzicola]AKO19623.1 hypothetical protein ACU11_09295 [Xanthomonas oryzae pv. oryzicola]
MRAQAMVAWHAKLQGLLASAGRGGSQCALDLRVVDSVAVAGEAAGSAIAELFGSNDLEYRDCRVQVERDMTAITTILRGQGPQAFQEEDPDEDYGLGVVYGAVRGALIESGMLPVF